MLIDFDSFNRYERPVLTLANPNRQELGQIGAYLDLKVSLNFNAVSELSFEYPEFCENGERSHLYDQIKTKRVIRTEQLGYFIITKCDESRDGIVNKLDITATSAEIELNFRKLNLFDGTFKFYDPLNPESSLLHQVLSYTPLWSVGYVSVDLWSKYRTFDIADSTVYGFLMNDVENAFECIFEFDTYARRINAYSPSDIVRPTDLYVSYSNLIKRLDIEENSDGIVTCMSCYGGGNLSIATVNPLGSATIYNFDHFKEQMSPSLAAALERWKKLISSNEASYQEKLLLIKEQNTQLLHLQTQKADREGELSAQKTIQAGKIQQNITTDTSYQALVADIQRLENEIKALDSQIERLQSQIKNTQSQLKSVNDLLSFKNRSIFSQSDVFELENYKYESTYQDDAFVQTSQMSLVEIQEMAQSLYDQSVHALAKASVPRYTISVDSVNFMHLPEFSPLLNAINNSASEETKQILGCSFHLEIKNGEYIEPILLNLELNYDDPTKFSMTFANRYRMDNSFWTFDDLYGEGAKTSSSMSFNIAGLKDWESHQNDLLTFANSSLDMTRNELVNNAKNIEMKFDGSGLIAKRFDFASNDYLGEQAWLTYNTLAFSKNKFATVETALGKIPLPTGGYAYGLNAGVLIGKAFFGKEMTLSNCGNTIVMDDNGFTMTTVDSMGRILLSPESGIKIQGNIGSLKVPNYKNRFYVDSGGNAVFEGTLKASEGTIGGWQIKNDGLYSTTTSDFIKNDGTGKLSLFSWKPDSATFEGNIYAKNIKGGNNQYGYMDGGYISNSTVNKDKILTGTGKNSVDQLYPTRTEFSALSADVANFGNLYAAKGEIEQVVSRKLTSEEYGKGRIFGFSIYTNHINYRHDDLEKELRFKTTKIVTSVDFNSKFAGTDTIYYVGYN